MKIALAQMESLLGDLNGNYQKHINFIDRAIVMGADAVFFPELSLVGYDVRVSTKFSMDKNSLLFESFQTISNNNRLVIGVGFPLNVENGVSIAMAIFQPQQAVQFYSKQYLDPDEIGYFVPGNHSFLIEWGPVKIAPAICYESVQDDYTEKVFSLHPNIYLASLINSDRGIQQSFRYFPNLAKKYSVPVLMVNSIGLFDQSISVGQSSVWSRNGTLLCRLDQCSEGMIIYNDETEEVELVNTI